MCSSDLLNVLSWDAYDQQLQLATIRQRYEDIIKEEPTSPWIVLVMTACANASFCKLFGGDHRAAGLVLIATLVAFFLRQRMIALHMDHRIVFMLVAFCASMITAQGIHLLPTQTPETAMATSVLFLIPGIPLINAINDIIEGYVIMGFARVVNASLLIICIALWLSATLLITGASVL